MAAGGVDSGFSCDGVNFDGTNDYVTWASGWSGVVDGNELLYSYWIKRTGAGEQVILGSALGSLNMSWQSSGSAYWTTTMWTHSPQTRLYYLQSNVAYAPTGGDWLHVLASFNAGVPYLYINNVNVLVDNHSIDGQIDFANGAINIGANTSGTQKMANDLAEFWYFPNVSLDLSVAANRAKFSEDGKPISLGTDGSLPTGTAPAVYLHQDTGEAPANFKDNKGTGGDGVIVGTLTASSTSPTD